MNQDEIKKLLDKNEMEFNKRKNKVNTAVEKVKEKLADLLQKYLKSSEFDYKNLLINFYEHEKERQKIIKNIRSNSLKLEKFDLTRLYKYKTKYYNRLLFLINRKIKKLIKKVWW